MIKLSSKNLQVLSFNTKDFFKAYSSIAGSIKKISKMDGDKKSKAENLIQQATNAMQEFGKIMGK